MLALRPLLITLGFCTAMVGCGGGGGTSVIPETPPAAPVDLNDLRPFVADSDYADVLVDCVLVEEQDESCALSSLPLIGMEHDQPTVADIMQRVVVSHDWMGERFQQALENLPDDIRLLLRATTAVVIDADIRPAYYFSLTGTIYLDPAYLWLTEQERLSINAQQDYRAGFADPLQFRSLSRYVRNNDYVYEYGLLAANADKTEQDVMLLIGELLYHELAHANDFLPPAVWDYLDPDATVFEAIVGNDGEFVGQQLEDWDPLTATTLHQLADVMYRGETATAEQTQITADEVGELFEADGASDHYAYSSIFEDVAMLFEETMMKYHFDLDRDVAFTTAPADPRYCDDYEVRWGTRNRVGDTDVKARAQFVMEQILPGLDTSMFFQEMPAPQAMPVGVTWCEAIDLAAQQNYGMQKLQRQLLPARDLHQHRGASEKLQTYPGR